MDLPAKQMNSMKILPIYCYNDDDNDFMTANKQQTLIFYYKSEEKSFAHTANTSDRLQNKQNIFS